MPSYYHASVIALAVGQGMGYVLKVEDRVKIIFLGLFDFGSINTAKDAQAIEQSARYLASLIRGNGNCLNSLVISHQDADHHNLLSLIDEKNITIDHYFFGGASDSPPYQFTNATVKEGPFGLCNCTEQSPFFQYPDIKNTIVELFNIACLSVDKYYTFYEERLEAADLINTSSAVVLAKVLVRHGKMNPYAYFLFPGDATLRTVYYIFDKEILKNTLKGDRCHLLAVPHHGARASIIGRFKEDEEKEDNAFNVFKAFLRDVNPLSAHVSSGYANQFGHPSSEIKDIISDYIGDSQEVLGMSHYIFYYNNNNELCLEETDSNFFTSVSKNVEDKLGYFHWSFNVYSELIMMVIVPKESCLFESAPEQGKIAVRREISREWKDHQHEH